MSQTRKVLNYPNPNCKSGEYLYMYVFLEMLKEFKVITNKDIFRLAVRLSTLNYEKQNRNQTDE